MKAFSVKMKAFTFEIKTFTLCLFKGFIYDTT